MDSSIKRRVTITGIRTWTHQINIYFLIDVAFLSDRKWGRGLDESGWYFLPSQKWREIRREIWGRDNVSKWCLLLRDRLSGKRGRDVTFAPDCLDRHTRGREGTFLYRGQRCRQTYHRIVKSVLPWRQRGRSLIVQ